MHASKVKFPLLANYCDNFKPLFGFVSWLQTCYFSVKTHGIKMYNSTSRGNYFKGIFRSLVEMGLGSGQFSPLGSGFGFFDYARVGSGMLIFPLGSKFFLKIHINLS